MAADGLMLPADAFRVIDREVLAGWSAYAYEQGRTAFSPRGIEVIDPVVPIVAYAAYAIGQAPDGTTFGLEGVPESMWLLVAALVVESEKGLRGRMVEVRASSFQAQPLVGPPPAEMGVLYEMGERYRRNREESNVPLGESLYGITEE